MGSFKTDSSGRIIEQDNNIIILNYNIQIRINQSNGRLTVIDLAFSTHIIWFTSKFFLQFIVMTILLLNAIYLIHVMFTIHIQDGSILN